MTKSVPLALELNGFGPDAYGGTRAGFTATGEINRQDFGVNWNAAMETGGVVVADKVTIHLEIEAVPAAIGRQQSGTRAVSGPGPSLR